MQPTDTCSFNNKFLVFLVLKITRIFHISFYLTRIRARFAIKIHNGIFFQQMLE